MSSCLPRVRISTTSILSEKILKNANGVLLSLRKKKQYRKDLTHFGIVPWGIVTPYGGIDPCQHWLRPDDTKPLPEPMTTYPQWGLVTPEGIFQMLKLHICDMDLKIINSRFEPHPPGGNELTQPWKVVDPTCCFHGIHHTRPTVAPGFLRLF